MFKAYWDHLFQYQHVRRKTLKADTKKIDRQIAQFLDRIVDANSPTVIGAYEKRITQLEKEKRLRQEKNRCLW
ncbi:MAG: hypothetical protein COC09_02300 [Gammaproteobacteria bacterium]|nr:hypothetical protein [Gammaproteobacteria bacterium]PCH64441.1 MAG: hypothetical protein COC09_02300 [Gammaproteobacteria bacterium]